MILRGRLQKACHDLQSYEKNFIHQLATSLYSSFTSAYNIQQSIHPLHFAVPWTSTTYLHTKFTYEFSTLMHSLFIDVHVDAVNVYVVFLELSSSVYSRAVGGTSPLKSQTQP